MQYKIESLATFDREVKRLSKRYPSMAADIKALKAEILNNPSLGVNLGNNVRKIRMRSLQKAEARAELTPFSLSRRMSTCCPSGLFLSLERI